MSESSLLLVEDDAALREILSETLVTAGYGVIEAADGAAAQSLLERRAGTIRLVVSDVQMDGLDGITLMRSSPDVPFILMSAYATIDKAIEAMRHGARDYLVKPFAAEYLLAVVARHWPGGAADAADDGMIALAEGSRAVRAMAERVAASEATVMISGESGVGKEVLARFIHERSRRAEGPFVAINCAAIPENMLEATLFGYEKGAFTGAYQACPGKFEQAQGGTLLLDEISEMDIALQAKLLRVLQEREVERLGGRRVIALDVRVLATTNRRLRDAVAEGRFREDLYYRLNVFPLQLPPLRERREDILPLCQRFLAEACRGTGRPVPELGPSAVECLLAYDWPGNVRELENVIARATILQEGQCIEAADLQIEAVFEAEAEAASAVSGKDLRSREQALILDTLEAVSGSRKRAAEVLGISQRTLRYKLARMREAGIRIPGVAAANPA